MGPLEFPIGDWDTREGPMLTMAKIQDRDLWGLISTCVAGDNVVSRMGAEYRIGTCHPAWCPPFGGQFMRMFSVRARNGPFDEHFADFGRLAASAEPELSPLRLDAADGDDEVVVARQRSGPVTLARVDG